MKAVACAHVEPGGVLRDVRSQPPLTLRQVHSDRADECALCLVGSAAGPLPGDDLTLALTVADDARAHLRATGASIAQGRPPHDSVAHVRIEVTVGDRAHLDADPGALIVCAGAWVEVELAITLAATASLRWRETVVFGRTDEPAGRARLAWNVVRAGRPLLRQVTDLTDSTLTSWPGMMAGRRTLTTELATGPDDDGVTIVRGPHDVTQRIADHATLRTRLT